MISLRKIRLIVDMQSSIDKLNDFVKEIKSGSDYLVIKDHLGIGTGIFINKKLRKLLIKLFKELIKQEKQELKELLKNC